MKTLMCVRIFGTFRPVKLVEIFNPSSASTNDGRGELPESPEIESASALPVVRKSDKKLCKYIFIRRDFRCLKKKRT